VECGWMDGWMDGWSMATYDVNYSTTVCTVRDVPPPPTSITTMESSLGLEWNGMDCLSL